MLGPLTTHAGEPGITFIPSWPVSFLTILPCKLILSDERAYIELEKRTTKTKDKTSKMIKFFAKFGQFVFFILRRSYFCLVLTVFLSTLNL